MSETDLEGCDPDILGDVLSVEAEAACVKEWVRGRVAIRKLWARIRDMIQSNEPSKNLR